MPPRPHWLHPPRHLAGRLALLSALQLVLVAGSLSWFTYQLGRTSGLERAERYRQITAIRELSQRLSQRLSAPRTINALNLLEIRSGHHRLNDYDQWARLFWREMQVFPVAYINYGGAAGDFVGVERTDSGQLLLNEDTPRLGRGRIAVSSLSTDGRRGRLLELIPGMSSIHEEAWYADTARAGRATWSAIYSWEDKPQIFSISYNAPIRAADGRLLGVIGVDMVLTQLSDWLASLWQNQGGLALIVEPDGHLVASSRPELTLVRSRGRVQRANLSSLRDPLAQVLHKAMVRRSIHRTVTLAGRDYVVDVSRWGHQEGLNWRLLTALPADAATGASARNAWFALLASALALGLAVLLANRQIRTLLRPLGKLQMAATTLDRNLMARRDEPLHFQSGLSATDTTEMQALASAISALVEGFNRLNALLRDKLRTSLQAAAVAHEINQPLSVLLLNSQLLLEQTHAPQAPALPADWRHQLQNINDEAARVVVTIEKMRTLLRNVQTEHQRVDLREVARSALLRLHSSNLDAALTLETIGLEGEGPAWVSGDAVQIQIAIVNLLRNAAEALREQPPAQPWISLTLERMGETWQLCVADNGPGLPPGADGAGPLESNKADGSGLGLFVVRTTMDNHHGELDLLPRPEGGTLARLRFRTLPDLPSLGD